jgi:hemerythrin
MVFVWTAELRIDDGVIDDDHRFLISVVNDFERDGAGDAEHSVFEALARLRGYAAIHFRREEWLQAEAGYPGQARHATQHRAMTRTLHGLCARAVRLRAMGRMAPARAAVSTFLGRWLTRHIIASDLMMAPVGPRMRQLQAGMQPLAAALATEHPSPDDLGWLRQRASQYRDLAEVARDATTRRHRYDLARYFDHLAADAATRRGG